MMYNPDGIVNFGAHLSRNPLSVEISLEEKVEDGIIQEVSGGCWKARIKKEDNRLLVTATLYSDLRHERLLNSYESHCDLSRTNITWHEVICDLFQMLTILEQRWYLNFINQLKENGAENVTKQ